MHTFRTQSSASLALACVLLAVACNKSPAAPTASATTVPPTQHAMTPAPSSQASGGETPRLEGSFDTVSTVTKATGDWTSGESPVGQSIKGAMAFVPQCETGVCDTDVKVTGSSKYAAVARLQSSGSYSWKAPGIPLECDDPATGKTVSEFKPSKKTVSITPAAGPDGTITGLKGTVTNAWKPPKKGNCKATLVVARVVGTPA